MFKIKISDGFCEWEYPLLITGTSIDDIHTALCEALGIVKQEGKCIKPWTPNGIRGVEI